MFRREFLRLATLASGAFKFARPLTLFAAERETALGGFDAPGPLSGEALFRLFSNPPNAYRPMVRWWWNGDRVTAGELLRELDVLRDSSIGGVEINPIRFPADADPLDTKALIWMSDEWIATLQAVLAGAKERGMVCDMIVGSGWPYGGEFLARGDQTQMMALGTRDVQGPIRYRVTKEELLAEVHPQLVSPYKDPLKELISLKIVPYELSSVDQAKPIPLDANGDMIEVEVPEGRHVFYFLVKLTGYMAVINGAPGASGPVLNHYDAPAVARYLDRISSRLISKLGPLSSYLRAFFTDSIELEGANWCDDMLEQFKQRRGYDLEPYLPFVLFKVGAMGSAVSTPYGARFSAEFKEKSERVRYDFETARRELFDERFVATFVEWCRKIGVKSRMQAYGMECDPISAGMMLEIPECETWIHSAAIESFGTGSYTHGRSYSMSNKFVSSAAHFAGKRLISCEEMTNTEDPFHTTMERIKVAGDQSMLSGVTQSVLHGFNYSPPTAPFPGWVRYGTYFSERNTWWPYFHLWVMYKARLSALFQMSEMQADIAILPPQADLASKYGFQRDPFPQIAYPEYVFKLWETVHQNGSGCDYLSENIIEQSLVDNGRIKFQSRSYKAILLAKVDSLRLSTAEKLGAFVESGGTLIFLDAVPHLSAGFAHAEDSRKVRDIFARLQQSIPSRTLQVPVDETDLVGWYRKLQQRLSLAPDVLISDPKDFVSQIHYRNGDRSIFFFMHYGPEDRHEFRATFPERTQAAWLWNPHAGTRIPLRREERDGSFLISLGPSESQLIVFETPHENSVTPRAASSHARGSKASASQVLHGPWSVHLEHIDGSRANITLDHLIDFNSRDDLKSFAGAITYSSRFTLKSDFPQELWLGRVGFISEVNLNGHALGVRWFGVHTYSVSDALQRGANQISIKIVTTLGEYMKSLKENKVAQDWTESTPSYPLGLIEDPRLLRIA